MTAKKDTLAGAKPEVNRIRPVNPGNKIAYNVREAAEALGVSEWYIRDEISLGRLVTSKTRGRLLIPRWELDRYIDESVQDRSTAVAAKP